MSLFDTIKYPISDTPTRAELDALPDNLYMQWLNSIGWGPFRKTSAVVEYYSEQLSEKDKQELSLLRKMIKEYDEPV